MVFITALDVPLIPILLIANFLLPLILNVVPCVGIGAVVLYQSLLCLHVFFPTSFEEVLVH